MRDIYAVLDMGSSFLKLVVGEVVNGSICILYSSKKETHEIRSGIIEDSESLILNIQSLFDEASKMLGTEIKKVALCIPSYYTRLYKSSGSIPIETSSGRVSREDVVEALKKSKQFECDEKEEIITVMPTQYYLDARLCDDMPIGEIGTELKVDSLVITTKRNVLYSFIAAVEKAGLQVIEISIDTYACAKEALNPVYLQEGVFLVDIGSQKTTVAFFEEGYLKFISNIKFGSMDFSRRLADEWEIPLEKADSYKIRYGSCRIDDKDDDLIHTTKNGDRIKNFTQNDLNRCLCDSVEYLMKMVKDKVDLVNDKKVYETIVVGGGAELPYIEEIASEILKTSVRTYRPETVGVRDMSYVFCLGMIYYLNERKKLVGAYEPSLVFPDVSNTMSYRLKGLTPAKKPDNENKKGFAKLIDKIFGDEKE